MTETAKTTDVVHLSIDVMAPIAHAFETFTQRMQTWWDPTHHLLTDTVEMRVDAYVGGTITDVGRDGSTCTWGRVLAYEPPTRFVFTWDVSPRWALEPDPDRCSEVEVIFTPLTETSTQVALVHRGLERHGDGWEGMAQAVSGPQGWTLGLERFTTAVQV